MLQEGTVILLSRMTPPVVHEVWRRRISPKKDEESFTVGPASNGMNRAPSSTSNRQPQSPRPSLQAAANHHGAWEHRTRTDPNVSPDPPLPPSHPLRALDHDARVWGRGGRCWRADLRREGA